MRRDREGLIPIVSDTFDVTGRLAAIDDSYYVVYNTLAGRFEVHSSAQGEGSLCVVVPYPALDARTVELVRRTRVERADAIFSELAREEAARERREYGG